MEQTLNIKGIKLNLNNEPQLSPQGRPMRLSGIKKNGQVSEKWINKEVKNHWIYTFRFLDDADGFINFEFDYYGNFFAVHKS